MKPGVSPSANSGVGGASDHNSASDNEGSPELPDGQLHAGIGTTFVNDDYVAAATRHIISEDLTGDQYGQVVTNGSGNGAANNSSDFDPAFVIDLNRNHVMSDSPSDGSPGHGTAEDAESEDTEGAHSKSEENENAEPGDVDVWEGSMFPFCEEGAPHT